MLGPQGDQVLQVLGREPSAKGIFEPADMPGLITVLQAAVDPEAAQAPEPAGDDDARRAVGLRQRVWPLIEMLRRSHAAGEPIVWGV